MDPLTILSIVGNIVQFVDFTSKLVSKGHQIYKAADGALAENIELEAVTNHLVTLSKRLKSGPPNCDTIYGDDAAMCEIGIICQDVSKELLARLGALKVKGRGLKWKSFRCALKTVWNREEINGVAARLAQVRQTLELHVLVSIRESCDIMSIVNSEVFKQLTESSKHLLGALVDQKTVFGNELRIQTESIITQQNRIESYIVQQHERTRTRIIDEMKETTREFQEHTNERAASMFTKLERQMDRRAETHISDLCSTIKELQEESVEARNYIYTQSLKDADDQRQRRKDRAVAAILRGLRYNVMEDRQYEVSEAHRRTFRWIFDDRLEDQAQWSDFRGWLSEKDSSLYWVNGKAGSGKSTLMKYLYGHQCTRELVSEWAGSDPFVIAPFFFWKVGSTLQRSHNGLLRSILHESLNRMPQLMNILFPEELAQLYSTKSETPPHWSDRRLMGAFETLITQTKVSVKLCFFIDGLDEYDGDHEEIAKLFKRVSRCDNIKVIVSSRPHLVFQEAFDGLPTLRLQDLTMDDIIAYVDETLGKHPKMIQLLRREPEEGLLLIGEIVTKAQGVFLWVSLVVKSMVTGLRNEDGFSDLQKRLSLLPAGLENLYRHMLQITPPFYAFQMSRTFQIIRKAPEPLSIFAVALAEEGQSCKAISAPIEDIQELEKVAMCKTMDTRLKARCSGLLETESDLYNSVIIFDSTIRYESKVQFLHRTVQDFLEIPAIWSEIAVKTSGADFDPHVVLLESYILQLKHLPSVQVHRTLDCMWSLVRDSLICATDAEVSTGEPQTALLRELERVVTYHFVSARAAGRSKVRDLYHWTDAFPPADRQAVLAKGLPRGISQELALLLEDRRNRQEAFDDEFHDLELIESLDVPASDSIPMWWYSSTSVQRSLKYLLVRLPALLPETSKHSSKLDTQSLNEDSAWLLVD